MFGEPGGPAPWGWRFGGHHVSLNNLVVDGALVATTPCFMGADPAASPLLGGAAEPAAARAEDLARELVRSLRPELAARAVLLTGRRRTSSAGNRTRIAEGDRVIPLAGVWRESGSPTPSSRRSCRRSATRSTRAAGLRRRRPRAGSSTPPTPKGLPAAELDAGQRELLRALLATYLDRVPAEVSPLRPLRRRRAALDAVHVAWAARPSPGRRTTTGCRARGC